MQLARAKRNIFIGVIGILFLICLCFAVFLMQNPVLQAVSALGGSATDWTLVDEQNYGSTLTDDNTVYHSGSNSVYFVRKSLYGQATITSNGSVEVVAGRMYESIVWIKSKNADAATEFHFQLIGNDESSTVLRGVTKILNTSTVVSPWTRVYTRMLIPDGITAVTPQILITNGSAELWFDTVEINEIDVSVVDQATHFEQDCEGNFNGFVLRDGQYVRTLNQLTTGDGYVLLSNALINPTQIIFYDVLGAVLQRQDVNDNTYCFIAPSCYYAEIVSDALFSTYSLQKIYDADMIETSKYWSNNDFSTTISEARSGVAFVYEGETTSGSYLFYDGASDNNVYFTTGKMYNLSVWIKVTTEDTTSRFTPYFKDQDGTAVYYDKIYKQNTDGTFTVTSNTAIAGGYDGWIKMTKTYIPTANFSPQFIFRLNQGSARVVVEDFCISETNTTYQSQVNALLTENPAWEGDLSGSVLISNASASATAGDTYTFDMSFLPQTTATIDTLRVHIYSGTQRVSATDILLPNGEKGLSFTAYQRVTKEGCSIVLPDWFSTGTYTLRLGTPFAAEPILQTVQITATNTNTTAKVENSTIYINDTAVSPMLYLGIDSYSSFESKPDKSFLKQADTIETISQSGIKLYSTFTGNLASMWKEDGTIDYTQFDQDIYEMLCTTSQAKVMVNIGLYAPDWWLSANPNEQTVVYTDSSTSKQNGTVSFASTKFRTDAGAIVQQILAHMQAQPYYNAVFAIKLSAGGTNEWQYQGFGDTSVGDYSSCALEAFRLYCQNKYGEISALNTAWGLSDGYSILGTTIGKTSYDSFADIALPTYSEIYTNSNTLNTKQKVIDWGLFVNDTVVDAFLYFAELVKTSVNHEKIVGGYGGYMWVHETAAIGFAGTAVERLYASPYIDFLSSPLTYHERYLGMSTAYMGLNDSLRAYGKIYLLEQDSRTSLRSDYGNVWTLADDVASGQSFNMQDTLSQLKRDFATNFVNGTGFWMYDMESGWYDDASIYQLLQLTQNAYENAVTQSIDYTNEVAVIIDDELYAYTARASSYYGNQLYLNLYRLQRQSLALMGAGYETYALSSLTAGKIPEHKVYLFLAPTTLNETELSAIDGLKKDGNYLVFISMVGTDTSNMQSATGMTMSTTSSYAMQVEITNTSIADGKRYGAEKTGYAPISYVTDSAATTWGNIVGTSLTGLAYKDNSTWHCVYSTAPNLPTSALRYILAQAGVHIYSQDSGDIIHSNSRYLSLYSQNSGEKTLSLGGYYQINDAYTGALVSARTNVLQYTHQANDTRLFALTRQGDYQITVQIDGETNADWYFEGDTVQLIAPSITGKNFVGWENNGEILSTEATYIYTVGNTEQTITATYELLQYTITWNVVGENHTQVYEYGAMPTYQGSTEKAADQTYTYTFNGWSPAITAVTEDTTYTAQYTQEYVEYTITWLVNGAESTETYHYGEMPSFTGNTDKAADKTYTYAFNGWSPVITAVTEDKTYTAQYLQEYVEYQIRFIDYDGTEIEAKTYHYGETVDLPVNPSRETDDEHQYTFIGWSPEVVAVNGEATYTAQYSTNVQQYVVTWLVDGVETTEPYAYGAMPSYKGETDKAADETYRYTFNGWSPTITTVTGNATYEAQYTQEYIEYTITWLVDGVESTETYYYGAMPSYKGETDKAADETYTYTFNGWSPTITTVTGNTTYEATYSATYIEYMVVFIDYDGSVLDTQTYHYGDSVTPPNEPTLAADSTYRYTFNGWSPAITTVTRNAIYEATYSATYIEYTVVFIDYDGSVLDTQTYHYGDSVIPPNEPTLAEDSTYRYTFNGWSPAITTVTRNTTYEATYRAIHKTAQITWSYDGALETEQVYVGETISPKSIEKVGYIFEGWYVEETLFDFTTPITQDITLRARFTLIVPDSSDSSDESDSSEELDSSEEFSSSESSQEPDFSQESNSSDISDSSSTPEFSVQSSSEERRKTGCFGGIDGLSSSMFGVVVAILLKRKKGRHGYDDEK